MNGRIAATMKSVSVILLRAVIRQRLTRHLTACYPSSIGEDCEHQGVDLRSTLKVVEYRIHALIYERHRSDLDCNETFLSLAWLRSGRSVKGDHRSGRDTL